jgi:hypothetical protein
VSPAAARAYVAAWSLATVVALALGILDRRPNGIASRAYLRFLARPWRLVTFAIAGGFFVVCAPFVGDPTWDRVDGGMMAALTFVTAPWSVGALFRAARKREPLRRAFVAACAWMLSASWCYDAWLFWRDGHYPPTWSSNLLASSVLYACGGLFWSLVRHEKRGVIFAFMSDGWFSDRDEGGRAIAVVAFLFAAIVTAMMLPFVWNMMR